MLSHGDKLLPKHKFTPGFCRQRMPVVPLPVQAVFPQIHSVLFGMLGVDGLLGVDPSVILQAGAVRAHMQDLSSEHGTVEDVSVLKNRCVSDLVQPRGV